MTIHPRNFLTMTASLIEGMAHVTRWHSRPVRRAQSVAEHSHQVALLAFHLSDGLSAEETSQVLWWSLVHDAHEVHYGDMPYPTKQLLCRKGWDIDNDFQDRFWGEGTNPMHNLPCLVLDLVAVADVLEAAIYSARWYPEASAEICAQAEEVIRARFNRSAHSVGFARAMEILEGLRRA